jgi:tetratricopeptide (TPR) repeat protein
MKHFIWFIASLVMALNFGVDSALAGDKEDCFSKSADVKIRACSAIIDAGTESPTVMARSHQILGNSYFRKGDYDRALTHFKSALSHNFQSEQLYVGIGSAHRHKGDFDNALEAFKRALELNPKSHWAYLGIGNVYSNKGLYTQAIQNYDKSIASKPDYADAYTSRGLAYETLGNSANAGADYSKALILKPGDDQAIEGLRRLGLSHLL